jgi:hypothetical protein
MIDDDVVPRHLVIADGRIIGEHESEWSALHYADTLVCDSTHATVEVVRSVRRWELDTDSGEMLEVGDKLKQSLTMGYADGHEPWAEYKKIIQPLTVGTASVKMVGVFDPDNP